MLLLAILGTYRLPTILLHPFFVPQTKSDIPKSVRLSQMLLVLVYFSFLFLFFVKKPPRTANMVLPKAAGHILRNRGFLLAAFGNTRTVTRKLGDCGQRDTVIIASGYSLQASKYLATHGTKCSYSPHPFDALNCS